MPRCLIGLGANLGDKAQTLARALAEIALSPQITLLARSEWFATRPVGGPAEQPAFLNGAATIWTTLSPRELLARLQQVEAEFGRKREARWGPRTLDLDLLLYGACVLEDPQLTTPHPRLAWRRFVLEPAAQIAADMSHPTSGRTIGEMWDHLLHAAPYLAVACPIGEQAARLASSVAEASAARLLRCPDDAARTIVSPDTELELLEKRAALLARRDWPTEFWSVSDFWFDQSLAWARSCLDQAGQGRVHAAWRARTRFVQPPKLLALAKPDSARDEPRWLALVEQARRSCAAPVLWLPPAGGQPALDELLAALAAMQ